MQYTRDVQRHVEGLVREGKCREALAVYEQAFQDAEPDGRAWYGMGYCLYKLGNYAECREALDKAIAKGYPAAAQLLQQLELKLHGQPGLAASSPEPVMNRESAAKAPRGPSSLDDDEGFEQSLKAAPSSLGITKSADGGNLKKRPAMSIGLYVGVLLVVLLVVTGVCVWAYYSVSVPARASLSLTAHPVEAQAQFQEIDVDVDVANEGTIPIYIENDVRQAVARGQFALELQQNAEGKWIGEGVAFVPAKQNGKDSLKIAPNGTLRMAGRMSCREAASNVLLRAVLSDHNNAKIFSNEAQVVLAKSPPKSEPIKSQPATPGKEQISKFIAAARKDIESGEFTTARARLEGLIEQIKDNVQLTEEAADAQGMLKSVKTCESCATLLDDATNAYQTEQFVIARSKCEQIIKESSTEPSAAFYREQAQQFVELLKMAQDPSIRFGVLSLRSVGSGTGQAEIYDHLTGRTYNTQVGDPVAGYRLASVDRKGAVLNKDGLQYVVAHEYREPTEEQKRLRQSVLDRDAQIEEERRVREAAKNQPGGPVITSDDAYKDLINGRGGVTWVKPNRVSPNWP